MRPCHTSLDLGPADLPSPSLAGDKRKTKSYIHKHYPTFSFEIPFSEHGQSRLALLCSVERS